MKSFIIIVMLVQVAVSIQSESYLKRLPDGATIILENYRNSGTNTYLRGSFRLADGAGIQFVSSSGYLRVDTMDGEILVEARRNAFALSQAHKNDDYYIATFQLLGDIYAEVDGRSYRLPASTAIAQLWLSPINFYQNLASLQAESPSQNHAAVQQSVERLVAHPAVGLLEPAARALGEDLGVIGVNNPASLLFYHAAAKLTEARLMSHKTTVASYLDNFKVLTPQKYPFCSLHTCPPCEKDMCVGLCGRLCNCWRWVCGDCCVHKGCLLHDLCCDKHGFISFKCFFPFSFRCHSFTC